MHGVVTGWPGSRDLVEPIGWAGLDVTGRANELACSHERIDGISALVNALGQPLLRYNSRSPYGDGRSMLILE